MKSFVEDDVIELLHGMHPTKTPIPDGLCALFYQRYWSINVCDVIKVVFNVLNDNIDPLTLIALTLP